MTIVDRSWILQLSREKLFEELGNTSATIAWNHLRQENSILHRNLTILERYKFETTIPIINSDPPVFTVFAGGRHYHKIRRQCRFRRRRKELRAASDIKSQSLNPINLSHVNINEHQITVLRKEPSFCPTPKDVNWQHPR